MNLAPLEPIDTSSKRFEVICICGTGVVVLPHDKTVFHLLLGFHPRKEWRIKYTVPASSNKRWQTREQAGFFNPQDETLGACLLTEY